MRRYATASGSTLSGVFIHNRMWGERSTPTAVMTALAARPKATVVWTARRRSFVWPAPKKRAVITPVPEDMPLRKPMSMKIRLPEELTAARAVLPRKLPTIRESMVL